MKLGCLVPLSELWPWRLYARWNLGHLCFCRRRERSVGAKTFANATLNVTGTADITNIGNGGPFPFNEIDFHPGSAVLSISGVASSTFTNLVYIVELGSVTITSYTNVAVQAEVVPEPGNYRLLGAGLLLLARLFRRKMLRSPARLGL